MTEKKNKFVVPTKEEENNFSKDLEDLAQKHSLHLEIIPQFKPNITTKAFEVTGILLLHKMVEDVTEGAIPSTNPEINPSL